MAKLTLKKIWLRLCLKTPSFFNRIKVIGASLSATCTALTATYGDQIPAWMDKYLHYGIVAGIISFIIAQLTVENPKDVHADEKVS